jgi:hypothetical protein
MRTAPSHHARPPRLAANSLLCRPRCEARPLIPRPSPPSASPPVPHPRPHRPLADQCPSRIQRLYLDLAGFLSLCCTVFLRLFAFERGDRALLLFAAVQVTMVVAASPRRASQTDPVGGVGRRPRG